MTSAIRRSPRALMLILLGEAFSPRPAGAAGTLQACAPDTPEHRAARAALDELDQQLRSLPADAAVAPYNQKLTELLATP